MVWSWLCSSTKNIAFERWFGIAEQPKIKSVASNHDNCNHAFKQIVAFGLLTHSD